MVTTAWGMDTAFEAIFPKLLLPPAQMHHFKPEDTFKRLFDFSDVQFDESFNIGSSSSSESEWETNHDMAEKYREPGCEILEIVYWNLAGFKGPESTRRRSLQTRRA